MNLTAYHYGDNQPAHTRSYLMPAVLRALENHVPQGGRVFELGCGNGANAAYLASIGYDITAADPSGEGVAIALASFPDIRVAQGSTEDDLAGQFGTFQAVLSLEVIEHVYSPCLYVQRVRDLLQPGGVAVISTPYHGYLKNLALAASGKMDAHFTALWEGGHIKFWSRETLRSLFAAVEMEETAFMRVGRVPPLAKSMVAVYRRR